MRISSVLSLVLLSIYPSYGASHQLAEKLDMPPSGRVTVPAKGGVEFDAMLNGQGPFRLIFDSGASMNALSPAVAKKLGLRAGGPVMQAIGGGSGSVPTQPAKVGLVQVGDLVLRDQTFLVLPMPWGDRASPVGEVGYELMKQLVVTVDYEHDRLLFNAPESFKYSGKGVTVPIEPAPAGTEIGAIEVKGSVDGASGIFQIDTGDEASVAVEQRFVNQHDLIKQMSPHYHGYGGSGIGGAMPPAYYCRAATLHIGDAELPNVIAFLFDGQAVSPDNAGNIGTRILRQFNITFDVPRGVIYIEKNSNWGKPEVFNRAGIIVDSIKQDQTVMSVLSGSPGEIAGVSVGDVILKIDGRAPNNDPLQQDDPAFLQSVGTVVHLTVAHGGETRRIDVRLRDLL